MTERIIDYIKTDIATRQIEDIHPTEDLLASGLVDSIGMMRLVVFLEKEFQIEIPPDDMTLENFSSVSKISDYLSSK